MLHPEMEVWPGGFPAMDLLLPHSRCRWSPSSQAWGVRPSGSAPAYPSGVISILPVVSSFCVLLLVFSTSCAVLGTISQLHWVQALQSMLAVVHVTFSLKGKREEGGEVGKDWAEEREWADRHTGPFWQFIMACRKEHYHLLALWALGNNGVLSEPHVP